MKNYSIENGYFVFTMMPSLHCNLRCPHCYLSLEQREDETLLSTANVEKASIKIDNYYQTKNVKDKTIISYWYGGEPTDMGTDYFLNTVNSMNEVFNDKKGYKIKHVVLSSLNTMKDEWLDIIKDKCDNYMQTSYDGLMRGKGYLRKWERQVKKVIDNDIELATITVVNHEILKDGAAKTLNYLTNLGIKESSWLPFMWNEQNNGDKYDTFAPTMNEYSKFMIELTIEYIKLKKAGKNPPYIGQLEFIRGQNKFSGTMANIAAQTLFLLPNGDFVLPDYKNKYQEYMRVFGNIIEDDFHEVLSSKERKDYLRKQITRNKNKECLTCEHSDKCIMEFWKDNREGDDCFGAKKYVDWVLNNEKEIGDTSPPVLF